MPILTQADVLRHTILALERLEIPYLVCGSFASGTLGEPRMTLDIDIVLQLTPENVDRLCAEFPDPDYYVSAAAARDAVRVRKQFNVIHPETGNKIDFMISGRDEWSRGQFGRRRRVGLLADLEGYTASPEDIIISKMRYYKEGGSDKHLRDCAGVLAVQRELIERDYIVRWATHFDLMPIWEAILKRMTEVYGN